MLSKIRKAKFVGISKAFGVFEKALGVHITVPHFYSPLPTLSELPDDIFERRYSCKGIDFRSEEQLKLLEEFEPFLTEFVPEKNIGLSLVDAFLLYCMIRTRKPNKMAEIGSGESTRIALKALEKNREEGNNFSFIAIEPYPPKHLFELTVTGFELKVQQVQEVPVSFFSDLDLLFIDSSHVSKIGSDVNYEILEIIPHMKKGALIHWHDIVFPQEYPRTWIQSGQQFWNESYMLQAFLSFNSAFNIIWASKYMQTTHADKLKNTFKYYSDSHNLTSLWVQKIS